MRKCINVVDGDRNLKILANIKNNTKTAKIRLFLAINILK